MLRVLGLLKAFTWLSTPSLRGTFNDLKDQHVCAYGKLLFNEGKTLPEVTSACKEFYEFYDERTAFVAVAPEFAAAAAGMDKIQETLATAVGTPEKRTCCQCFRSFTPVKDEEICVPCTKSQKDKDKQLQAVTTTSMSGPPGFPQSFDTASVSSHDSISISSDGDRAPAIAAAGVKRGAKRNHASVSNTCCLESCDRPVALGHKACCKEHKLAAQSSETWSKKRKGSQEMESLGCDDTAQEFDIGAIKVNGELARKWLFSCHPCQALAAGFDLGPCRDQRNCEIHHVILALTNSSSSTGSSSIARLRDYFRVVLSARRAKFFLPSVAPAWSEPLWRRYTMKLEELIKAGPIADNLSCVGVAQNPYIHLAEGEGSHQVFNQRLLTNVSSSLANFQRSAFSSGVKLPWSPSIPVDWGRYVSKKASMSNWFQCLSSLTGKVPMEILVLYWLATLVQIEHDDRKLRHVNGCACPACDPNAPAEADVNMEVEVLAVVGKPAVSMRIPTRNSPLFLRRTRQDFMELPPAIQHSVQITPVAFLKGIKDIPQKRAEEDPDGLQSSSLPRQPFQDPSTLADGYHAKACRIPSLISSFLISEERDEDQCLQDIEVLLPQWEFAGLHPDPAELMPLTYDTDNTGTFVDGKFQGSSFGSRIPQDGYTRTKHWDFDRARAGLVPVWQDGVSPPGKWMTADGREYSITVSGPTYGQQRTWSKLVEKWATAERLQIGHERLFALAENREGYMITEALKLSFNHLGGFADGIFSNTVPNWKFFWGSLTRLWRMPPWQNARNQPSSIEISSGANLRWGRPLAYFLQALQKMTSPQQQPPQHLSPPPAVRNALMAIPFRLPEEGADRLMQVGLDFDTDEIFLQRLNNTQLAVCKKLAGSAQSLLNRGREGFITLALVRELDQDPTSCLETVDDHVSDIRMAMITETGGTREESSFEECGEHGCKMMVRADTDIRKTCWYHSLAAADRPLALSVDATLENNNTNPVLNLLDLPLDRKLCEHCDDVFFPDPTAPDNSPRGPSRTDQRTCCSACWLAVSSKAEPKVAFAPPVFLEVKQEPSSPANIQQVKASGAFGQPLDFGDDAPDLSNEEILKKLQPDNADFDNDTDLFELTRDPTIPLSALEKITLELDLALFLTEMDILSSSKPETCFLDEFDLESGELLYTWLKGMCGSYSFGRAKCDRLYDELSKTRDDQARAAAAAIQLIAPSKSSPKAQAKKKGRQAKTPSKRPVRRPRDSPDKKSFAELLNDAERGQHELVKDPSASAINPGAWAPVFKEKFDEFVRQDDIPHADWIPTGHGAAQALEKSLTDQLAKDALKAAHSFPDNWLLAQFGGWVGNKWTEPDEQDKTMFDKWVLRSIKRFQFRTTWRALKCFKVLESWCSSNDVPLANVSAKQIVYFLEEQRERGPTVPANMLNSLRFLVNKLGLNVDLTSPLLVETTRHASRYLPEKSTFSLSAVAAFEHIACHHKNQSIKRMFSAWRLMMEAGIRFQDAQRAVFQHVKNGVAYFTCWRRKQKAGGGDMSEEFTFTVQFRTLTGLPWWVPIIKALDEDRPVKDAEGKIIREGRDFLFMALRPCECDVKVSDTSERVGIFSFNFLSIFPLKMFKLNF